MSAPTLAHHRAAVSGPFDGTSNRRSACDRCRSHKLRCERGPDPSQCRRCQKANAKCATGATLKSGRPVQLYSMQQQRQHQLQENSLEHREHLSNRQALLDFPTPPPTTFNTLLDTTPLPGDVDLDVDFLGSPGSFNVFDEIWANSLDQETTTTVLAQLVASHNANLDVTDAPFIPVSDIRSQCLNKLGNLQTNVLADLQTVKACKTAEKCTLATEASPSGQGYNFLIGRMLDHSTALVEILNCFESPSTEAARLLGENALETVQAPLKGLRCDIPTMFSLLSCYVCLTRIYRTIFACIYDSMPFLLTSNHPVPQLFPGMNLGGFNLESRLDLQIKILVQVSEDMLMKIEAKFGVTGDTAVSNKSIFDHDKASKMLRIMLEEEAREQPQLYENRSDCKSLRNILADLKRMIMEGVEKNNQL